MRTLQEKYNAIQEGSFSKDQFLRDARMQHPTLVTQYNGYDDAVKILKNRGMISEATEQEGRKVTDHPFVIYTDKQGKHHIEEINYEDDQKAFLKTIPDTWDVYETKKEAIAEKERRIKKKSINEGSYKVSASSKEAQYLKKGDLITGGEVVSVSSGAKTPSGKVEVIIKGKDGKTKKHIWGKYTKIGVKPEKETVSEARLTKKNLADYRYKPTNDMDKYPYEQILRGLRVELEGMEVNSTPTAEEYKKALEKVLKNLEKDEIFYTNQLAGKKKSDKTYDQMIPVEKNNVVDKSNGMEKIKNLKEDHTGNTKDKYKVKFSKTNNTYQVWEGDHLVTDFATKEKAKAYADNENKKQGLEERVMQEEVAEKYRVLPITKDGKKVFQVMKGDKVEKVFPNRHEAEFYRNKLNKVDLKEGIKNLIKNLLAEDTFDFEPGDELEFTNRNDGNKYQGTVKAVSPDKKSFTYTDPKTKKTFGWQAGEDEEKFNVKKIVKEEEEDFELKIPVKKIQNLVNVANALIEKAVDTDGDPIGVVDTSGTWQEPDYYKSIEFDGKTLVIRSTSQTGGHKEVVDEYEGENLIYDGIPSLQMIIRLYKKALKKHNIEESNIFETVSLKDLLR
jgi:hypothetical protein